MPPTPIGLPAWLPSLCAQLANHGLDLIQPFAIGDYNAAISDTTLRPIPTFGRVDCLGLVIGNTAALWPAFTKALAANPALRASANPVDSWVTHTIKTAAKQVREPHILRWSYQGGDDLVGMLHAAEVSGLAVRGPVHLAVHPTHGPWFALRAVMAIDAAPAPADPAPNPCLSCDAPCRDEMARALKSRGDWRAWLAVRDACPVGVQSRYAEPQLSYHYTKNRSLLP